MTARALLCIKPLEALHIASNEACGRGSVAFEPGYNVGKIVSNSS